MRCARSRSADPRRTILIAGRVLIPRSEIERLVKEGARDA